MEQLHSYVAWIATALTPDASTDLLGVVKRTILESATAEPGCWLQQRLGLGESEQHVVWLLCAIALEPAIRGRMAMIDGTPTGDPTIDGIRRLVYGATSSLQAITELSDRGRLRALRIMERSDGGPADLHETRQTWAISRRVLEMLHGGMEIDHALTNVVALPDKILFVDDLAIDPVAIAAVRKAIQNRDVALCVSGMPGLGRRSLLVAVAAEADLNVLEIKAERLAKERPALAVQLRSIARECRILARVPLIVGIDALDTDALDALDTELVSRVSSIVLATSGTEQPGIRWRDRPAIVVELDHPRTAQRARLWTAALGEDAPQDADYLATRFPMAPALIARAAEAAKARVEPGARLDDEDVYAGIRSILDDKLSGFASRQTVTQTWEDLVLAGDQMTAIRELIARIRQRTKVMESWRFAEKVGNKGLGVSALFHGVPGSGKSMVCGLIAKELGLDLYMVDMSKITSKWIGETEKALASLFDAAEAAHAVLMIDEADSLLGRRTDQKTSNDRYANQTTNFLLYRLEAYTGIVFMTTNHEANMDPAFARRLSLRLRFDLPEAEEREQLWRAMLPREAPVEANIDFASLARRYEMSGGYIRNAVLRAAFLAADSKAGRLTGALLERAARAEAESMGKIIALEPGHSL